MRLTDHQTGKQITISIAGQLYQLPNGIEVLPQEGTDDGLILYTRQEWETMSIADYEIQTDGAITFQGQPTGWSILSNDLRPIPDRQIGCIYCGAPDTWPETPVPAIDDEAAWQEQAFLHLDACQWVRTRAHRLPDNNAQS